MQRACEAQWRLRIGTAVVLAVIVGAGACEDSASPSASLLVTPQDAGACSVTELVASKHYKPKSDEDGIVTFDPARRVIVPPELDVVQGNAGNHVAELTFQLETGIFIACRYRGGASKSNPADFGEIFLGHKYLFDRCDDKGVTQPGIVLTVTSATLHIESSSPKFGDVAVRTVLVEPAPCDVTGDGGSEGGAGEGGTAGSGGSAGTTGSGGTGGSADSGGSAGTAGTGGTAGTSGTGGTSGAAGTGGTSPDCMPITAMGSPPSVPVCGDGWRDPASEECDDNNTSSADACTGECRVQPVIMGTVEPPDAAPPSGRYLGTGRHTLAQACNDIGLVYADETLAEPSLRLSTFSGLGVPVATTTIAPAELTFANPVVAGSSSGRFVVAWTDFNGDGDELGVALRALESDGESATSITHANSTTNFSQYAPDIIWTGSEFVVAWQDDSALTGPDLRYRRFDDSLSPVSSETTLAATSESEGRVALAPFADSFAAAWRSGDAGSERIRARAGHTSWSVGPFLPGDADDAPALVALDDSHLFVLFTEGTDPEATGVANVGRLRAALLDSAAAGDTSEWLDVDPLVAPYSSDTTIAQSSPAAAVVDGKLYVAWRSAAVNSDDAGEELWLKAIDVTIAGGAVTLDLSSSELTLPRYAVNRAGDQRRAALLGLVGAVASSWEDSGNTIVGAAQPEVLFEAASLPLLRSEGQ